MFVSVPFTTYALLAGLQTIPERLYEAAASTAPTTGGRTGSITLPLLRPAFLVAALINIINVFNSFPIIWEMTRGGPGHETSYHHGVHVPAQAELTSASRPRCQ